MQRNCQKLLFSRVAASVKILIVDNLRRGMVVLKTRGKTVDQHPLYFLVYSFISMLRMLSEARTGKEAFELRKLAGRL